MGLKYYYWLTGPTKRIWQLRQGEYSVGSKVVATILRHVDHYPKFYSVVGAKRKIWKRIFNDTEEAKKALRSVYKFNDIETYLTGE